MYPHNLTRAQAQARARLLSTQRYDLDLDLTGRAVKDPAGQFVATAAITFSAHADGETGVDLVAERVLEASLDGVVLEPVTYDGSRLPFTVTAGEHELRVRSLHPYSRTGEGLHRFVDPADQAVYLYTQFEAAHARQMYACFDQPDLKAVFATTVHAPAHWTVIGNGAETSRTPIDDTYATWTFADTARISTYLTALVAGDYQRLETEYAAQQGPVIMGAVCRRSLAEFLDADRIFETTKAGFGVFEDRFGFPYPFDKYDTVFVPEYNSGAMENVGCVTVRDQYVFRSRATQASYLVRDDTLLHELSHMWFGDLVTMRWWDDLWLKESFATWAANFALAEIGDASAAWANFTNGFKTWAFRQDQLPTTHPIAADMVDLEAVDQNFDGITYSKGASVLVQLVAYVGQDAFLAGAQRYFTDHAYDNTKLSDLLAALSQTSGRDLTAWARLWLQTTGVNTLLPAFEVAGGDDGRETFSAFAVEQAAAGTAPTLRPHRIAIGLYRLDGAGRLVRVERVETDIDGARTEVAELVGRERPDLVLVNDDDLTYAKVRFDQRSLRTVLDHLAELDDPLARAVCWAATWDMCRDGELPARDYVELVLRAVATETDHIAVRSVLTQALGAARHYSPLAEREDVLVRWQQGLGALLEAAAPGSDLQLALAKAAPGAAQDAAGADRLAGWLDGSAVPAGLVIDPELRWSAVVALSRLGRLDEAAIAAEEQRDPTNTGMEQAGAARAARPTADAKAEAWRLATADPDVSNARQGAICLAFWQRGQDEVLAPYQERYLEVAADISAGRNGWADRGYALRNNVLRYLFPVPREIEPFLVRLDSWLADQQSAGLAESVRRVVVESRDDLLRSLRAQTAAG